MPDTVSLKLSTPWMLHARGVWEIEDTAEGALGSAADVTDARLDLVPVVLAEFLSKGE